jgi:ribosome-interacting GTPase 1
MFSTLNTNSKSEFRYFAGLFELPTIIFYSYTLHKNQSNHPSLYSYTVKSQPATTILYIGLVSIRKSSLVLLHDAILSQSNCYPFSCTMVINC